MNARIIHRDMNDDPLRAERIFWLSRLAASVAHELGNPLQSIRSCLDLTSEDTTLSSETAEYIGLAREELDRIADLLARLRLLYRSSYQECADIDLDRLIADADLFRDTPE
jgi:signal transduction histidine kinase